LRLAVPVAVIVVAAGIAAYRLAGEHREQTLSPAIPVSPGQAAGFNVVLFTLDTLRADRVGCYGYEKVETPVLDSLATGGVRFADAVTVVPLTLPSHSTIMTGNYPPRHGVRNNGTYRLVAQQTTLAERLKAAGYATAAFIGAFVLESRYGVNQGFDVYNDRFDLRYRTPGRNWLPPERPADAVTDAALRWLDEHQQSASGQPFFMWLHLFDPHLPYDPPEPFRTRYASDLYVGEIAFTDQQVGRTIQRLRDLKLLDHTLVVAVADHGESLGQHGENAHGLLIYRPTIHVPLLFYAPAIIGGGRVVDDRVVTTADLAPTILDLLGLELGPCDGLSLLRAGARAERAVYIESLAPQLDRGWSPLYGLRRHLDEYIEAPTPEYYDLVADSDEVRNLFSPEGVPGQLRAELAKLTRSFPPADSLPDARVAADRETLGKLAALGYVGGGSQALTGPAPDPKEVIAHWESQWNQVQTVLSQGRYREAIPLLKDILADTPGDGVVWALLANIQGRSGLVDEALASQLKSIQFRPNDVYDWVDLARLQRRKGDLQAVQASLDQAERLDPDNGEIYLLRAVLALDQRHYQEALTLCEQARARDPSRQTAAAWATQARAYEATGQWDQAELAYDRALQTDPRQPEALIGLTRLAARNGQYQRAIELAQQVELGEEQWPEAQRLLAVLYLRLEQGEQAIRVMHELVQAMPGNAWAQVQLGNVLLALQMIDEAVIAYQKAVELAPHDAQAHYELATALAAQGNVDASIDHLRQAVSLKPDFRPALEKLVELLTSSGRAEEADQVRTQIEALDNPSH
jgi:arylsulfatase A-like enzyme/tetratricopeptide (TPR) repeat protein